MLEYWLQPGGRESILSMLGALHLKLPQDQPYLPPTPLSSSYDSKSGLKIAVKKLSRPFQSIIHAKRTYRELRLLKHMKHENVSEFLPQSQLHTNKGTSVWVSYLEQA